MSQTQQTRDQRWASKAYEKVSSYKNNGESDLKKYGGLAHKLPILIRSAGLVQALAFIESRHGKQGEHLLDHLAQTLGYQRRQELMEKSRSAGVLQYAQLTREVLGACLWFKRFAVSVLGVKQGQEEGTP